MYVDYIKLCTIINESNSGFTLWINIKSIKMMEPRKNKKWVLFVQFFIKKIFKYLIKNRNTVIFQMNGTNMETIIDENMADSRIGYKFHGCL